ncbi:MAG: flagellar biosynthesis protein FlhB [Acetivibrionales bacterium]|jgi:flagellar biosynthetic protein FlhB|nr:flagellar biosynthesis protein FlhB [Clostridiales bacterium]HQD31280.1 flagellar biosynthesis protein FlhB [Clostridiales bacterium]
MIYRIDLQLFARGPGGEDRTEKATPKKRREAREKGQVFQSREINTTMVLLFAFISLRIFGTNIYKRLAEFSEKVFTEYPMIEDLYMPDILLRVFIDGILVFFKAAGPVLLICLLTGLIVSYAQVGFLFTTETLKPSFRRISPLGGMKRLFSMRAVVELAKAVLKVVIIAFVSYSYLNGKAHAIMSLMDMDILGIASFIGITSVDLAIRICVALLVLGAFDFAYQWWEYEKSLKMTKQEVKEEFKQQEGNPEIKSRIRQKQRQLSMRRMMQEVPKADVVITNPTHFACALKYDEKISPAPVLLAKGQDYIALRIKEIAAENDVEVVENKPLARTIYETVEIGEAIPPELYQAVAEVLAFVYSLKGKTMAG